jgi:flagellar brake protein
MSFLDTVTAAIDQVDFAGPWEAFRSDDPRRCVAAMQQARIADTPVTLGGADGASVVASLWSVDEGAGRLHFNVNDKMLEAAAVAKLPEVWAAMYQGSVKVQFLLRNLALNAVVAGRAAVRGAAGSVGSLAADLPRTIYSLPRRKALRVRRAKEDVSVLRLRHPLEPGRRLALRILDISLTGCALRKPAGMLALLPGTEVRRVEVDLDDQTVFFTDLTVMRVTLSSPDPAGDARLGCRWHNLSEPAQQALALWIESGRSRRERMALHFD